MDKNELPIRIILQVKIIETKSGGRRISIPYPDSWMQDRRADAPLSKMGSQTTDTGAIEKDTLKL